MRILEIRETTAPLRSSLRNAFIDFSQMTTSVVQDGHVHLPDTPGIGYEAKPDLYAVLRAVAE